MFTRRVHSFTNSEAGSARGTVTCRAASPKVCVVGSGVIGLASALRIQQSVPNAHVSILGEKFGNDTTTAGAAGVWGPYRVGGDPDKVLKWGRDTFDHLMQLFHSEHAFRAGVSVTGVHWLLSTPEPEPLWKETVYNFEHMPRRQLDLFQDKYIDGWRYTSVTCEGRSYLPWLTEQIRANGGSLQQRKLSSLTELQGYDLIVNCTGIGAHELVNDKEVQPIRGQTIRVRAPWVTQCYNAGPYYIIPNRNFVVLGGTTQVGNWNRNIDVDDRERIYQGCLRLLPSLAQAEIVDDWVGLRPGRSSPRLEIGTVSSEEGGKGIPVVHSYGHGGAGLTLGWGCAGEVAELARVALQ